MSRPSQDSQEQTAGQALAALLKAVQHAAAASGPEPSADARKELEQAAAHAEKALPTETCKASTADSGASAAEGKPSGGEGTAAEAAAPQRNQLSDEQLRQAEAAQAAEAEKRAGALLDELDDADGREAKKARIQEALRQAWGSDPTPWVSTQKT